ERRLRQPEEVACAGVHPGGGQVREVQSPDHRGVGADGAGRAVADQLRLPLGAAEVEGVDGDRADNVVHDDAGYAQVLAQPSPTAPGLHPDHAVGALEHAGGDDDVAHSSRHLAADHHAAVTVHHGAAGDRDVLAGHSGGGRLGAGLDRDAVIAHVDVAAADVHVAA